MINLANLLSGDEMGGQLAAKKTPRDGSLQSRGKVYLSAVGAATGMAARPCALPVLERWVTGELQIRKAISA